MKFLIVFLVCALQLIDAAHVDSAGATPLQRNKRFVWRSDVESGRTAGRSVFETMRSAFNSLLGFFGYYDEPMLNAPAEAYDYVNTDYVPVSDTFSTQTHVLIHVRLVNGHFRNIIQKCTVLLIFLCFSLNIPEKHINYYCISLLINYIF